MANETTEAYLPAGLPIPVPSNDDLDKPYWEAARNSQLVVQQCDDCKAYQWGPESICTACLSTNFSYTEVAPEGVIFSWERPWHPVHPALRGSGPYIVVLVELPHAGNVRMVGNLLGDPQQDIVIGAPVEAVFEHHNDSEPAYTLVQWRVKS